MILFVVVDRIMSLPSNFIFQPSLPANISGSVVWSTMYFSGWHLWSDHFVSEEVKSNYSILMTLFVILRAQSTIRRCLRVEYHFIWF